MFCFFFHFARSFQKPVFIIPGITDSVLMGSWQNAAKHYYCSKSSQNNLVWPNTTFLGDPTLHNCIAEYLALEFDPLTRETTDPKTRQIFPLSATGNYKSQSMLKCDALEKYFINKGYTTETDLFFVSYDWRNSLLMTRKNLFPQIKKLIEDAVTKTGKKAVLVGYSMGSFIVNKFLTEYADKEEPGWVQKHVEQDVYLAPALAGSMGSYQPMLQWFFEAAPGAAPDIVRLMSGRIPGLINLMPNHEVYANHTMVIGPNAEKYSAETIETPLRMRQSLLDESYEIYRDIRDAYLIHAPVFHQDIYHYIIYNDLYDTITAYDFSAGWDKAPKIITGPGDTSVPLKGIEFLIKQGGDKMESKNLNKHEEGFNHGALIKNPVVIEDIYNRIQKNF